MEKTDQELAHESIHAEYRQALADEQWKLAQANARNKVKDRIIADLTAQLERTNAPVS